jgi:GntR family transcriptional regulator/MocR family aminotransferase
LSGWTPTLFLDPQSREPVYLQIAQALMREIHRGRFQPGAALPGYRTLAEQLGVSRNTVMSAYHELQAEGWVVSKAGEGSVVAAEPPLLLPQGLEGEATRGSYPEGMGFDLAGVPGKSPSGPGLGMLRVGTGIPDPRLLPGAELARAYRRALTQHGQSALTLEDSQGHPKLREALSKMLSGTRGIPSAAERILVTRGSQMAAFLTAQALFRAGDVVAVEAMGDRRAWDAFAHAGARCLPLPMDAEGPDTVALESLLEHTSLRAVLVTPRRQYPTLAVLAPERRTRLLELAGIHRFAILEVDQDSEFQFEGRGLAPLAAQDPAGVVIHMGTLSKIFSPGLRLGFIHGPEPLIQRMKQLRLVFDRQGDMVLERAMAELMEDGEIQRHLNRMQQVYRRRRDAACEALSQWLGARVSFSPPPGGLALWIRTNDDLDVDAWAAQSLEQGVAFQPGRQFAFEAGAVPGLRLGFANHDEAELEEVARRMAVALGMLP